MSSHADHSPEAPKRSVLDRFQLTNIFSPPTTQMASDYAKEVKQESPTIYTETMRVAHDVYKTLVDTTTAVAKSPVTLTRAGVTMLGNILALPSIGLHYIAKGIDSFIEKPIDDTRDQVKLVFEGGGGGGGGHDAHGH
jgi:hypothetical protein